MLGPQASYTGNLVLFLWKFINPIKVVEYATAKTKVYDLSFWCMFKAI